MRQSLHALPQPLVLLDSALQLRFANEAFYALAGEAGRLEGRRQDGDWDFATLRPELERLSRDETCRRAALETDSDGGIRRRYRLQVRRIDTSTEKLFLLTVGARNKGRRRRLEGDGWRTPGRVKGVSLQEAGRSPAHGKKAGDPKIIGSSSTISRFIARS